MEIIGYPAAFLIGLVLGLIGGGGSLLAIPILVYLFSFQVADATAYSLVIVGATSIFGACQRFTISCVDLRTAFIFGLPSVLAVFITRKWLVPNLPDSIILFESLLVSKRLFLLSLFSVLTIGASYVMITKNIRPIISFGKRKTFHLFIAGCMIGVVTGIVGIGGGFLIIPAMIYLANLPFNKAVGTSLIIIAIKSLFGFAADASHFAFDWQFLVIIIVIAIAGIFVGNRLSVNFPQEKLKTSFGWLTLVLALFILARESTYLFNTI